MDILDEMTKEEIIMHIRGQAAYMFNPPKKSALLWTRWQIQQGKLHDRRIANIEYGKTLDLSKRDELAKQFNFIKDTEEKLLLLKKMKPYEKKLQIYLRESEAIMEYEKKVNKLYAQYKIERDKERS